MNRREILAAFLGLPVALAACRENNTPPLPPGEIVGTSDVFGHQLRDGLRIEIPNDAWSNVPVVIVGGGIAGLAAAWHLQRSGFQDFVLMELEKAPGGTSRSGTSGSFAFPWGAHYIPAPMKENTTLISLLDEMGVIEGKDDDGEPVIAEQFLCRDPEERIFYKGRWYEGLYLYAGASDQDRREFESFTAEINRWVSWRDAKGRRAFTLPVSACSDDAEVTALDRLSMGAWMDQQGLVSPRLRWWVDYACRDDYGMTVDQTSAWAGLFYFCARMLKPDVESQSLITWPEGNGRIVNHLFEKIRSQIQLDRAAIDINPLSDRIEISTLDRNAQNPRGFRAQRVIFAAPQFMARYVIRPYRDTPPAHLSEFQFGSWMVANLTLKDGP